MIEKERIPWNKGLHTGNQYTREEFDNIANVKAWVKKCNPNMEYVDGFKDFDSFINIRCTKCGDVFPRSMVTIRHGRKTHCMNCTRIVQRQKEEARQKQLAEDKRLRHETTLLRQAERKRLFAESRRHDCPVCGKSTTRPKYCSTECGLIANRKKHSAEQNAAHEARRRVLIKTQLVDKDISLKKLYDRESGRCWICGMPCDYTDKTYTDKTMIAGDLYPSIDHVIALSDGGSHAWDNVRLAHRICNVMRYYLPGV